MSTYKGVFNLKNQRENSILKYLRIQNVVSSFFKVFCLLLLATFSFLPSLAKSQQYPVKLVPVVMPPYSVRLSDYATGIDNKLQLQVLMTDLLEPQHQTGIRFFLEAGLNGVPLAQNGDFVLGMQPFMLYPGNSVTLTNVDLRALFELQNLNGINASQYAQALPEGPYQFCFQAYDYFTKNILSQKTCATVFLKQNDPPMLNLPQNGEKIQALSTGASGNGIVFQWMPRQVAPNTTYTFILKELWDMGQSPISGFLSSPSLYTGESIAPTLYYGLDKPQLIPGKRYAWQVQAKSGNPVLGANPTENNGVYKNNGLSEIFYFDYVENCLVPTFLIAKNVGRGRVELSWSLAGQASGLYNIQYRKKGSTTDWESTQSYQPKYILTGLEDQTEYEYRVGSVCGSLQTFNNTNPITGGESAGNAYSYSGIQYFTTDSKDKTNQNYQCGVMPAMDISNKDLLQGSLKRDGFAEMGDFTAGDFPVTVITTQGSNGLYSGTGYIVVPYLADTRIKVSFNNIKVNTDRKLIEGVIETTYDPNETAVAYASAGVGELFGDAGVKEVALDYNISDIKYVATPPPGKIIISGDAGAGNGNNTSSGTSSQDEYPGGKDYQFKDKDGDIWTVDEKGNVTKDGKVAEGGASTSTNTEGVTGNGKNAVVNQYTANGVEITWEENAKGKYAYDTQEKTKLPADKYPSVKDAKGNTVYVPYKATVNKETELFNAKVKITDPALKDARIIFKTLSIGKKIPVQDSLFTDTTRNYTLSLRGSFDYAEEEVVAVLMPKDPKGKQQVISSFRLVHLSPKTVNVSLVPLDANSKSKLQSQGEKLNQIYNKIGVNFNVKEEAVLDIKNIVSGDTINSEDADLMSTYSPQQQQINAMYKGTDARYVLFITDKKSSTGQRGYMRLNGKFGYVYNNAQDKTGAHELGHGVFKLEHPWKAYGTTEGTTRLLMDYSTGEELSHLDWKQINDPALKLYAFQSQSSGEFNGGYVVSPDYKIFTIGTENTIIDRTDYSQNSLLSNDGTIPGFKLNGIEYWWKDGKYVSSDSHDDKGYSLTDVSANLSSIKDKNLFLFFDKDKACGNGTYLYVHIEDYLNYKKTTHKSLKDFISTFKNKPLGTDPQKVEYQKKELVACSNNDSASQQNSNNWSKEGTGNGTETREETLQKLNDIVSHKLKEKFPEKEVKFTVLDKKDPQYQQKLDEALKQANYVITVIDEEGKVQIKSSFKIPEWLANAMPDLGKVPEENCGNEYINEGLISLQNSALYKNALRSQQIAMEIGVIAYRGLFGTLYCMTDEKKFVGSSNTNQFIGGAMHEAIATFDVAQIVDGVISLVKSGAEQQIMAPINYYNNLKNIAQKGSATPIEVLKVILIPPMNAQVEGIEKGVKIGDQFIKHYFTECDKTQLKDGTVANLCWYRYGQITVMVVPLVITAGEWAVAKIGKIAELAKVSQTLASNIVKLDAQLTARGLILAEEGSYTIIKNAETGVEITRVASKDTVEIEKAIQNLIVDTKQVETLLTKYPQLKSMVDNLGDLKQSFLEDFARADDAILAELSKPNSELFNAWKNYRVKFKTQVICH